MSGRGIAHKQPAASPVWFVHTPAFRGGAHSNRRDVALGPGVWVGSWGIVFTGGVRAAGARHLALALVDRGGRSTVYELVGPWERWHSDITPSSVPHYGAWSSYRWFRVAEPAMIPRVESAVAVARAEFQARWYWPADSNRFVGDVLAHAGLSLTPEQQSRLGWIPGFGMYHRPLP